MEPTSVLGMVLFQSLGNRLSIHKTFEKFNLTNGEIYEI